jgi:ectoine hydroxylase-related dioxygenase (phytanoyl-CoA dioxygenase family)
MSLSTVAPAAIRTITEDEKRRFQQDGVVCLRGILSPGWVEVLREGIEQVLASPGPDGKNVGGGEGGGRFAYDDFMWTFNDVFRRFQEDSPMPEWAATLLGSRKSYLACDVMFVKEPGTPNHTPWHHDQPYLWMDGQQVLSFWTPLDTVTYESGGLDWIRGSHRWGRWFKPKGFDPKNFVSYPDIYEDIPDIEAERDKYDMVRFDVQPGDVIAHHLLTLHHSPGNSTGDRRRRAVAFRYAGDDVTFATRVMGPLPMYVPGLKAGEPIACDHFPQVWPRQPEGLSAVAERVRQLPLTGGVNSGR